MAMKTMTIRLLPSGSVNYRNFHVDDLDDDIENDRIQPSVPRKRKRLTHLSPDERLNRRKLKNRIAAQTARDRKKQRMDELEEAIADLQAENRRLNTRNDELRSTSLALVDENTTLRTHMGLSSEDIIKTEMEETPLVSAATVAMAIKTESESAEGTDSETNRHDQLHSIPADDKCDNLLLLDLLEEIAGFVGIQEADSEASPGTQGPPPTATVATATTATTNVVGPTTAELESLKELIQFDHVYYKPALSGCSPTADLNISPDLLSLTTGDVAMETTVAMDTSVPSSADVVNTEVVISSQPQGCSAINTIDLTTISNNETPSQLCFQVVTPPSNNNTRKKNARSLLLPTTTISCSTSQSNQQINDNKNNESSDCELVDPITFQELFEGFDNLVNFDDLLQGTTGELADIRETTTDDSDNSCDMVPSVSINPATPAPCASPLPGSEKQYDNKFQLSPTLDILNTPDSSLFDCTSPFSLLPTAMCSKTTTISSESSGYSSDSSDTQRDTPSPSSSILSSTLEEQIWHESIDDLFPTLTF